MTPVHDRDEFFIGYDPPLPPRLSRFIVRLVVAGTAGIALGAAAIAVGHVRLDGGSFEFGQIRMTSGTIVTRPYPALVEDADDAGRPGPWRLLVAPGKHGAEPLVRGLDGVRVTLAGTRIERGGMRMIEVRPGSIARAGKVAARAGDASSPVAASDPFGSSLPITLRGEIVDSKCFLGVMTPGDGRTHSPCASLCLRGGIPPALLVRDRTGRSALYLLEDAKGEPMALPAAAIAGEPVEMRGAIGQRGRWPILRTDSSTWKRLGAAR